MTHQSHHRQGFIKFTFSLISYLFLFKLQKNGTRTKEIES